MTRVTQLIQSEQPSERQSFIIETFSKYYGSLMQSNLDAWKGKFRKMAASPFAFYRGSAALFYADMVREADSLTNEQTSRVWIQGDMHAENFGAYMNSAGVLVFDVNDYDESYVGPYTWDVKRLVASLALLGYQKALSDADIQLMIETVSRSYLNQINQFAASEKKPNISLTIDNTTGKLHEILQQARLNTRVGLLDNITSIQDYDRRITLNKSTKALDEETKAKVRVAFDSYLETIPKRKRFANVNYVIKDMASFSGAGIGSAGLQIYSILLEGPTQALENDIIISMKQAATAAPSHFVQDANIKNYFLHDGHRTVISQRALQSYSDPWLGYTVIDGKSQLVAEVSPYTSDVKWDDINKMDDILELLEYMGRAVAKVHSVSDEDSDQTLINYSIDEAISKSLAGRNDDFVEEMVTFGQEYGKIVRDDHELFVDAFRNHHFRGI